MARPFRGRAAGRKLARIACCAAMCGAVVFARAEVLFEKCDNVGEAKNFWYHPAEGSDTRLLAFNEKQDVAIDAVRVQTLNRWDDVQHLGEIRLEKGRVDSHMLYFLKGSQTKERLTVVAEVEFDAPILGFVGDGFLFAATNPLFAPDATHQQVPDKPNIWSLEEPQSWTALDEVTVLSPTRIRIRFTNHSKIDPLRVFTLRGGKRVGTADGAEKAGEQTPRQQPETENPSIHKPAP